MSKMPYFQRGLTDTLAAARLRLRFGAASRDEASAKAGATPKLRSSDGGLNCKTSGIKLIDVDVRYPAGPSTLNPADLCSLLGRSRNPASRIFLVTGPRFMTELPPLNVGCMTGEVVNESAVACTVAVSGLVKSRDLVVEFLTLVSGVNIAVWFLLYRWLHEQPTGSLRSPLGIKVMLLLSGAYVFGCAFRSFLPRADVQRICLFDTWLSSIVIGRTVATVAEICFAAQWVLVLHRLGTMTGADTTLNVAWVILPLIIIAECFSWYAVLTRNYLGNSIENSLWAVAFFIIGIGLCRLLPEFDGPGRMVLAIAVIGIAGYLAFLMTIDVPMYLRRWRTESSDRSKFMRPLAGLYDVSTRWVVTHDLAEWKDEIPWMSLYFSVAVWASLALCVFYSF
jgi:hypothetical protein